MDERRDPPAQPGSHPPIASGAKLAAPQEAWGEYVSHATKCGRCKSRDGGKCATAEELYRAYTEADADAYRQVPRITP